jgi:PAS domain S-box-containing protein
MGTGATAVRTDAVVSCSGRLPRVRSVYGLRQGSRAPALTSSGATSALRHTIGVGSTGKMMEEASVEDLQGRIRLLEEQLREARVAIPQAEIAASSEKARAEAELQYQWRTFDTALSHNLDFNYIFDLQGRFTYVNRALLSLWKKPLEEAVGKNFFDLEYPNELAERLQRQIQQVVDTREILRDHTPYVGAAGETGYYEYTFVPVIGETGEVEAVAGSTRDVTDHVRMKQALALSEQKLQQVFSQAPVAIVVTRGREFTVEMANPTYCTLVNRDLVGRRFEDAVPELSSDVWEAFRRVMDTGEPFVRSEFYIPYDQNEDGVPEDHWFNVVYHPLSERDGTVSGLVAVCSEVTTQVLARKELERVNRELEEFAYVASHDLQEPLRTINIYTQLLLRRYVGPEPEAQQFGELISQGVSRMGTLITDLLTYSRTVQRDELPIGEADLSVALADAISVFKADVSERGAKITAPPLPIVRGDAAQLTHVFQNLLSNALKYAREDVTPEVEIFAQRSAEQWIIGVRDNGIGFDPKYSVQIFRLFKRLHGSNIPGTGLGLAICQRIVERYGGTMWAESEPGKGSTFYFGLPPADGGSI